MIRFAIGLGIPYFGILAYQAHAWGLEFWKPWRWSSLAGPAISFSAAILTAVLLAIVLNDRRPRQLLSRPPRSFLRPAATGAIISVLTLLLAIPAVVFGSEYAPDWLLLSISTLLPALLVLSFCKSIVPGACVGCGFDLRASLDAGRCPECGREFGTRLHRV